MPLSWWKVALMKSLSLNLSMLYSLLKKEGLKFIKACEEMRKALGKEKNSVEMAQADAKLYDEVKKVSLKNGLKDALSSKNKLERYQKIEDCLTAVSESLVPDKKAENAKERSALVNEFFAEIKKDHMRDDVLEKKGAH